MKRTAEITLETVETFTINPPTLVEKRFCPLCGEAVEMIPPHVIAALSDLREREIFRLVESDRVYSFESDVFRVCITCLVKGRRKQ